jgi:hypothetical protein
VAVKDGESGFVQVIEDFALERVEIQIHSLVLRRFAKTRITSRDAGTRARTVERPEMGLALFGIFCFSERKWLCHIDMQAPH